MSSGSRPLVVAVLFLTVLLACESDRASGPIEPTGALSAAGACKVAPIVSLIPQIYVSNKSQSTADSYCGTVTKYAGKGQHLAAVVTGYQWLTWTFDLYRAGALAGGSEDEIEQLFDVEVFHGILAASFVALPNDDPPNLSNLAEGLSLDPDLNGVVVEQFGEACDESLGDANPCIATTPNRHAALKLQQNGVHVVITILPPVQTSYGDCTAISNGLSHDCFDFQLHVAVFPEGAVVDPGVIGMCVNDQSAFAPDSDVVLRVTKGETDQNGSLALLPAAAAPSTVDCSDVEVANGLQGRFWAALEPAFDFLARPAYANPGKLGASVTTFSPMVPVDQEVRTGTISGTATSIFDEVSGADVTVYDPDGNAVATTKTAQDGTFFVGGLPILGEDGTTYTVTVMRNGNLQDTEAIHLDWSPKTARDASATFELFPPGQ